MKLTVQQKDFVQFVLDGIEHGALQARAGCGKTGTILAAAKNIYNIFPQAETLIAAYNKSIEIEISEKVKRNGMDDWRRMRVSTMHSLGWQLLKNTFNVEHTAIKDDKVQKLIEAHPDDWVHRYSSIIAEIVSYGKGDGLDALPGHFSADPHNWFALIDHYDVDLPEDGDEFVDNIVRVCRYIYKESLSDTKTFDFDDMILMPVAKNIRVKWPYDYVFLDEAQDLSVIKQALAVKFLRPRKGRLFLIGDDRQAIYGFTGADADAMHGFIARLNAHIYPLNVTWRCPRKIVELAQTIVPDLQYAESAIPGEVKVENKIPGKFPESSAVLCRNNRPLISLANRLMRMKIPVRIEGKEFSVGIINLIEKWKVKSIDGLETRLEQHVVRQTKKWEKKPKKLEDILDQVESVRELCRQVKSEKKYEVADVVEHVQNLFANGVEGSVTLCSYHKSKGREWHHVYLLDHEVIKSKTRVMQEWETLQAQNLEYVAYTRAQRTLTFLNLEK